jgi:hypothetical protein
MNEPGETPLKPTYKWPWFVLAAVLLFVALAIVAMKIAVNRERQERNYNAPLPNSAPMR